MWHGEVTLEERHRIVHRFAENISPGNDSTAAREKLAAYTKQIEEDMFELANSKMEYHQLMAEKLDAIQKNLDQSLRSSLSNQGISSNDLQASRTHPGAIPPVAVTTGQAQPLILPRGSQWNPTSTSSVQTPQPPIASCAPFSVNHPVQMNNIDSVSVGQVFGAALPSSVNTLRPQKSQLPCTPVKQPPIHYSVPSPSTVVGLPPAQCQFPLGMSPLPPPAPALLSIPASLSELHPTPVAGAVPDALQVQSTSWGQTSNGSTVSSPNRASDPRMVPTSADLTTAPPCSSGSWPPAGKRPFSGVEVAEETTIALQIPEATNLNRSKTQDPQQPEEAMCAKSSEDSLADCEPTMTETEPPHKKQKMDPVERTQVATLAQELYAAHQKYVKYVTVTITQNTEKVGDLMGRLYGPPNQANALKDTEDAKALTFTLKKALALLKCFLEDS
ncbi:histone lysine acetyltransferase CREBBP-like [Sceloporus undulatus]|uniref:histone lysine acetyltransferase CREBBP-like n=1 Tax=Sceloporus undulatus TaxID=8520 RepID=UPI001C4D1FD8|nr:histone lysine acetyltransferase CREBBP-like [Sceloporus undulatus]